MAFQPCNLPLNRLIEIHAEQHQRGQLSRRNAMARRAMQPGTAQYLDRYEKAVEIALKKLHAIEQTNPELLEDLRQ